MIIKRHSVKLRDCAVCGNPVPDRPMQNPNARCCGPTCAHDLAHQEDPSLSGLFAKEPELLS